MESQKIEAKIRELTDCLNRLSVVGENVEKASSLIAEAFRAGNKLLLCGNGGSAAEAQHVAAEYVSSLRSSFHRRSLPAIALTTDTSFITAASNDFGYDSIFERQIESLGRTGDVLIAISTSGNSENVVRGVMKAREKGVKVIGLTGSKGGKMEDLCDILFKVPSDNTARIQECHLLLEHTMVEFVENRLFGKRHGGKVVLIMQARMGSTRLPGKSMMPLAGKPLIQRIIERVKKAKTLDTVVLATTKRPEDDVLCEIADKEHIKVFRGSEMDLVDRYYQAAKKFNADIVVRLPADNPVVEPGEIDRIVKHYVDSDDDFSSNTHNILNNGYPDGLGVEVFSLEALEDVRKLTEGNAKNREHPHTYFYEHPERYKIGTVKCPADFSRPELVLDVNTREEYEFLASIYEHLYPQNPHFHITDIIHWYEATRKGKKKNA